MTDFLFHKVSDDEREEIKKQAKKIIDDFSEKLANVADKVEDSLIESGGGTREETEISDGNFSREIMFENAPEKNKDFIVAEKKKW